LPLDLSLFRLDGVSQASYVRDSIFSQSPYNLRVLAILNQQSLPESERRGPCYSHMKCVGERCKKWESRASGHHVVIYVTSSRLAEIRSV
jgi:hypothetical protein